MDVDCDGDQSDHGDGRCGSSRDTQSSTAFPDKIREYSNGAISDVNANYIPYVVLGNDDTSPAFDPRKYGVKELSVMAVVCGDNADKLVCTILTTRVNHLTYMKQIYGVWADTNGDDGPPLVGEASISLATACYGHGITGDNGYDKTDVLYIAFPGSEAVPKKAAWTAKSFREFEDSISDIGDSLIMKLS